MSENRDDLRIQTPCHMKWSELEGDGPRRWCDRCALHVVDGTALTQREARRMVEQAEERVCMRIVRDGSGRAVHRDDAPRSGALGRVLRYGLTAAAGVLVACGDDANTTTDGGRSQQGGGHVDPNGGGGSERPPEIMGEVCFPGGEELMGDVAPPLDPEMLDELGAVAPDRSFEIDAAAEEPREIVGRVLVDPSPGDQVPPAPGQ
jgi:hypothetical protein